MQADPHRPDPRKPATPPAASQPTLAPQGLAGMAVRIVVCDAAGHPQARRLVPVSRCLESLPPMPPVRAPRDLRG